MLSSEAFRKRETMWGNQLSTQTDTPYYINLQAEGIIEHN